MFLSKVAIVPRGHSAQELAKLEANGNYASHQLLWKLFTDQKQRNFLYREEMAIGGLPQYYILSGTAPAVDNSLFHVQSKTFKPHFEKGVRLAFKLRVNPTVCLKNNEGKSQRHDVLMHAKHQALSEGITDNEKVRALMNEAAQRWIADPERLKRWGFTLDALPDIECYTQHTSRKKQHQVQFSTVDFQGILTIDDPDLFLKEYAKGYGRAKSMGCGLMMIRPL
jgi:CRISPR system Cascade subunit CasE